MSLKSSKTSTGTLTPGAWMLSQNIESSGSQTFSFFPVCQHIHSFYVKTPLNIISNTDAPAKLLFLSPRKQNYKSSLTLCAPPPPPHWCCLSGKWKKNKSWLTGLRHVKSWVWTEVRVVSDRYWSSVSSPPVSPTSIVSDGEVASVHLLGGKTEEELVSWWRLIRINGADRLDRLLETNTSINVTSGERAPTSRDTTHCWDVKSGHRQRPLSLKNSTVK